MKEHYTLQEIIDLLSIWISKYERPDIIQARLIKVLDNESQKKNDEEKSTIYLPIIKATSDFIGEYEKMINKFYERDKAIKEETHEKYLNRKANGLGFGIISNSVSQIALYSALDTYEKNNQLKKQETEIWAKMNSYNNASASTLAEFIIELYETKFSQEIKSAIKEAYEIL